jgi:gentisate 1,2-dioxygenase
MGEQAELSLAALNGDIREERFQPGWDRRDTPPMWPEPRTRFEPAHWRFETAVELLKRSSGLLPPERSERRNLIMVNPHEGNDYPTLRTQVLAYQMVLPGDEARTHRHSPHAGRIILDAQDAYTVVNGVGIPMRDGDVVLTPGMHWHGHGHEGTEPAFWVDFLDIPLVQLLEPMYFEPYPGDWQPAERRTRDTPLLFPYEDTVRRLAQAAPDPEGFFRRRVQLGEPALPTIGLHAWQLEAGEESRAFRTTANCQYVVVEGEGSSVIGGVRVDWSRGDAIAVPSWHVQHHASSSGATLIAVTDEPLQRYCGYLRTEAADGSEPEPLPAAVGGFRAG